MFTNEDDESMLMWGGLVGMVLNLLLLSGNGVVLTLMVLKIYRSVVGPKMSAKMDLLRDSTAQIYESVTEPNTLEITRKASTKSRGGNEEAIYHVPLEDQYEQSIPNKMRSYLEVTA